MIHVLAWAFGTIVVLYVLASAFEAWVSVKHSPKTPMFLCEKHGAIPEKDVYHLSFEQFTGDPVKQDYCPFCYEEKIKEAKARLK